MENNMAIVTKFTATLLSCAALLIAPSAHAGLIALYTYDTASNLGLDSSGKGNNLASLNSTPASATGVFGGAVNFSGANALYSTTGTLNGLPTGNSSYTISSWINPTASSTRGIVGWGNYGNTNQVNALRMNGDNSLINYWWDRDLTASTTTNLVTGSGSTGWHFVAATYDAATGVNSIFIDGALASTRTAAGPNAQGLNFAVGRTFANEYFYGQMDNTAIFDQALTAAQLKTISANNFSQFGVAAVPEPSSVLLLGIGALAVFGVSRRKQAA